MIKQQRRKRRSIINQNQDLIDKRKSSTLSDGEKKIAKCLKDLGVAYEREYYMKGLFNPATKCPLFFDFYLPRLRIAIEFDGSHHFKPVYGEKQFNEQVIKDKIKNKFCNNNGIWILRIPYWKKDIKAAIIKYLEVYYSKKP
jgi:hypothetical protein